MPPSIADITHIILMIVGSIFKYSPIPPQTPAIFLSVLDLYNLFIDSAPFPDVTAFYAQTITFPAVILSYLALRLNPQKGRFN